jgi:hypothetical protein
MSRRKGTNHLSLGDQLTGVELGSNRLQDLVDDRGEHSLVVVGSELSVAERSPNGIYLAGDCSAARYETVLTWWEGPLRRVGKGHDR